MRLITKNSEMATVSAGDSGSGFGSGWVTIYMAEDSYSSFENNGGGGGGSELITIKTTAECDKYYPLPAGREWNTTCKTEVRLADADVGPYPQYDPNWNKRK